MAPQVGLEPTTDRLTADCSTTELLRNKGHNKLHEGLEILSSLVKTRRIYEYYAQYISYRRRKNIS